MQIGNFNVNFGADYVRIPHGADYEILDTLDLKRNKQIPELSDDFKKGEDVSEDRDKLIYSRVAKAMKDAAKFVEENPQYSLDDVTQDLIVFVVDLTDKNLKKGVNNFSPNYAGFRDEYFSKLKKKSDREKTAMQLLIPEQRPNEWEKDFINKEEEKRVEKLLKKRLIPREYQVLRERYGFTESGGKTGIEISNFLNVTRQAINQTEKNALNKLRKTEDKNGNTLEQIFDLYA